MTTRWDYEAHLDESVAEIDAWLDNDRDNPIPFGSINIVNDWVKEQRA